MYRNTSGQKWRVYAYNSTTGAAVPSDAANITAKISKDFGAASSIAGPNPTEIEGGFYDFDLTQSDTNGHELHLIPVSGTSNVVVVGVPQSYETREVPIGSLLETTVSSVTSTTVFVLADGPAIDDFYNGKEIVIADASTDARWVGRVSDYDGSTKTLTVDAAPDFTVAAGDALHILASVPFDPSSDSTIVGSLAAAALNSLANTQIDIIGALARAGEIHLVTGCDYTNDELTFTQTPTENWPDLTGATVKLSAFHTNEENWTTPTLDTFSKTGSVVTATGSSKVVKFLPAATDINQADGTYDYQITATLSGGEVVCLRRGKGKMFIHQSYDV